MQYNEPVFNEACKLIRYQNHRVFCEELTVDSKTLIISLPENSFLLFNYRQLVNYFNLGETNKRNCAVMKDIFQR